ncbi:MAG: hypothetical protein IKM32_07655 [Clostridia bacterium]|nr:hypothetical protein [Clostridia bacterium]
MKKLSAIFLIIAFLLAFTACGNEGSTADESVFSNAESSNSEQSKTESIPAVSEPESASPQESLPEESLPEESLPEESEPEESLPEESVPEESDDEYEWSYSKGFVPFSAAKGYKIVYTKVKPINALSCITTDGVAGVYDGKITRFFDARTGEFYCSEIGKWEPVICGDGFWQVDEETGEKIPHGPTIYFDFETRLVDNRYVSELVAIDYDRDHGHGCDDEYYLYDGDTGKIYYINGDDDGESYNFGGDGLFTCTLWEDLSAKIVFDYYHTHFHTFDKEYLSKKFGLVTNESIVIPFEYDYISNIKRSTFEVGVVMAVKDGKTYYFASDGTNLTPEGFDCGTEPVDNRAWVFKDGQGYIIEFY